MRHKTTGEQLKFLYDRPDGNAVYEVKKNYAWVICNPDDVEHEFIEEMREDVKAIMNIIWEKNNVR